MKTCGTFWPIALLAPWITSAAFGYEIKVHDLISGEAYSVSNLRKSSDALGDLGLNESATFQNSKNEGPKNIEQLIRDGARFEDTLDRIPRVINHFFDPLTDKPLTFPLTNYTSPDWALEDREQIDSIVWTQKYSYPDARKYFYDALTLPSKTDRDRNFGLTFQTVGHVIHHLQDMTQPQHVRNDQHLEAGSVASEFGICLMGLPYCAAYLALKNPSGYEAYSRDHPETLRFDGYAAVYPGPPLPPDDVVGSPFRTPRDFWQSNPYPAGVLAGRGIAEFTNSNFVSAGTNFNSGKYVLPALDPTLLVDVDIQTLCQKNPLPCPSVTGTMRMYGTNVVDRLKGPPTLNPYASTYSVFDADLTKKGRTPVFTLNRFNYQAAQDILIPMAVGYSAGLINFFFRGSIDLVNDPDDSSSFRIANWGSEALSGVFGLYYDAKDGQRKAVSNAKWNLNIAAAAPNATNPSLSAAVTFAPPLDANVPGKYVLVFNGDQGQEKPANGSLGAVIGKIATVQHLAGLYVAGLDAQGELVYLRVDRGGTHILSPSDFNPLGKAPLPSLPSDPFPGYVSKVYKFKQVKFGTDATGGPGYSVVALALKDIPDPTAVGVWRINDTITYDATTRSYSYVNGAAWRAISPDPTIGRFLFSVVDPFGPLSYVRSWTDAKGQSQYAVGAISLPSLTGSSVVSYWGFHDGTLFISPDGLTISGLESEMPIASTTAGTVTTSTITRKRGSVRITLGAVPSATLVEEPYISALSQQDTNSLSTVPIGTDGLSPPNGCVDPDTPLTFVVSQATYSKKVSDTFTTGTPVGYFNGTLSTYFYSEHFDWSDTTDEVFDLGDVGLKPRCCLPTNSWVKTNERGAWVTDVKRVATLQFEDGTIPAWTTSNHRVEDYTRQYEGCYSGLPPYPPVGGSSSYFEQVVTRALTGKAADTITHSQSSPAYSYRWQFRGIDITGHSYAADASPLGEVFFALSDLSVVIHEPLTGRMPKIEIPTNVIKLIAALWM